MNNPIFIIIIILNFIRCFPHLVLYYLHKNRSVIQADTRVWLQKKKKNYRQLFGFIYLLSFFPEFRNLFYNRIGYYAHFLKLFCFELSTLYLFTEDIGEGFYISHGFASGIGAKSIGKNCCIHHHVIIGNQNGNPTILDNVIIYSGAVIVGNITIGNNTVIGANATVNSNVPDNCTVYPASCRIMKWNYKKDIRNDVKNYSDSIEK